MSDNSELLRTIPMFEELSDEDLELLAARVTERRFRAGEIIFNQGDPGAEMFVVSDGHVNIHLPGEASRRISLKDVARGEYFGELALFDEQPRSASALATTAAKLLVVSREMLSEYLEKRPRAAMAILHTMSERLRQTNAMLSERAAKNMVEEFEKNLSWGSRLADKVAELNGSWAFIIFLFLLSGAWALFNSAKIAAHPADPFPYVFYNLLLALLVSLQGPLIMMSQNRQGDKDRATAATDFKVNLKNEVNIETIMRELGEFRSEANDRLVRLEQATGARPADGDGAAAALRKESGAARRAPSGPPKAAV